MSTDQGSRGYGTAGGGWASGANSYAANTGKGNAIQCFEAGSDPAYPYIRKPNGGTRTFVFKDQNGGSAVVGAKVYLREHYSQQLIGPIRVTDATGTVVYRNLDTTSGVYYTIYSPHPTSTGYTLARADWIRANSS